MRERQLPDAAPAERSSAPLRSRLYALQARLGLSSCQGRHFRHVPQMNAPVSSRRQGAAIGTETCRIRERLRRDDRLTDCSGLCLKEKNSRLWYIAGIEILAGIFRNHPRDNRQPFTVRTKRGTPSDGSIPLGF